MDEYEGLTPAEYEADRARARQIRFNDLPVHIQRNILRLREPGAFRELFKGASNDGEAGEFLTRYIAEIPVETAQLAPRSVRNAVSPSNLPYIQTPTERRADEMLMQRLGKDLSEDDMRFFLEGNYGFRGV